MTPILHTLTNLLNPWRTIRRLKAENRRLEWQASDFIDKVSQLEWRNQLLKGELATAKEALRRVAFGGWFENSQFSVDHHARVVEGVADWVRNGMAGPLPPLPEYLAQREKADAGEAP